MFEAIVLPQIEITRFHLNELKQRASAGETQTALNEALAELDDVLEELNATAEELKVMDNRITQIQAELENDRTRFSELYNFIPFPLLYTDREGLVVDANHACYTMLGIPEGSLGGKPMAAFVALEHRRHFRMKLSKVRAEDAMSDWSFKVQPRVGMTVLVRARVCARRDNAGRIHRLRWMLQPQDLK